MKDDVRTLTNELPIRYGWSDVCSTLGIPNTSTYLDAVLEIRKLKDFSGQIKDIEERLKKSVLEEMRMAVMR